MKIFNPKFYKGVANYKYCKEERSGEGAKTSRKDFTFGKIGRMSSANSEEFSSSASEIGRSSQSST